MVKWLEYTTIVYRNTARFPVLSYTAKQINFWIIANLLLVAIIHLHSLVISETYHIPLNRQFGKMAVIAVILGLISGSCLGIFGYYQDRKLFRTQSLVTVMFFKTLTSLSVLFVLIVFIRYVFDHIIAPALDLQGLKLSVISWRYIVLMLIMYYFMMSVIINFINQVNQKYGPGVVIPLLLGFYRKPREEERIFMFMDLKSSTSIAEKLGHLEYSSFIRDCFSDINKVLYPFRAQVYQYVGDEIVVTWAQSEGLKQFFCLRFYFAVENQFVTRADYYEKKYGVIPDFKAGVHTGMVTTIEIGELKREIAYHGDTLNTAARIQSVCNQFGKNFIVSQYLMNKVGLPANMKADPLGMVHLKGKKDMVELVAVELMA